MPWYGCASVLVAVRQRPAGPLCRRSGRCVVNDSVERTMAVYEQDTVVHRSTVTAAAWVRTQYMYQARANSGGSPGGGVAGGDGRAGENPRRSAALVGAFAAVQPGPFADAAEIRAQSVAQRGAGAEP